MMDYFLVTYLNGNQTSSAAVITSCNPSLSEHGKNRKGLKINGTVLHFRSIRRSLKMRNPFKIVPPEQSSSRKLCQECLIITNARDRPLLPKHSPCVRRKRFTNRFKGYKGRHVNI